MTRVQIRKWTRIVFDGRSYIPRSDGADVAHDAVTRDVVFLLVLRDPQKFHAVETSHLFPGLPLHAIKHHRR